MKVDERSKGADVQNVSVGHRVQCKQEVQATKCIIMRLENTSHGKGVGMPQQGDTKAATRARLSKDLPVSMRTDDVRGLVV